MAQKLSRDQKRKAKLKARARQQPSVRTMSNDGFDEDYRQQMAARHAALSQGKARFVAQREVTPDLTPNTWWNIQPDPVENEVPRSSYWDTQAEAIDFAMAWMKVHPGVCVRVVDTKWQLVKPYRTNPVVLRPTMCRLNSPKPAPVG